MDYGWEWRFPFIKDMERAAKDTENVWCEVKVYDDENSVRVLVGERNSKLKYEWYFKKDCDIEEFCDIQWDVIDTIEDLEGTYQCSIDPDCNYHEEGK